MTAPDRWICVNVGLDSVDAMAKEMSIIWLVVDFFSNYHRSEVKRAKCRHDPREVEPGMSTLPSLLVVIMRMMMDVLALLVARP